MGGGERDDRQGEERDALLPESQGRDVRSGRCWQRKGFEAHVLSLRYSGSVSPFGFAFVVSVEAEISKRSYRLVEFHRPRYHNLFFFHLLDFFPRQHMPFLFFTFSNE